MQGSEYRGFLGVNLSRDRLNLEDAELAKAINADLHTKRGTIVLRLGRSRKYSAATSGSAIRRIAKVNGKIYAAGGTALFRDQTSILTGLSANLVTIILPFRPLNDTTIWAFIADNTLMRKDNGTNVRNWGIAAPTVTPTVAITVGGGSLSAGDYQVKFTYVRKDGSSVAHESNPSSASTAVTAAANDRLALSGMTASSDTQVTHKRIYRTVAGGTTYLFDSEIADSATTATLSKADTALGSAVETDNNVPPNAAWAVPFQEHIFLCRDSSNPHYLWYSKRFRPESVPSSQFLEIGNADDPLQCAVANAGLLGVFSRLTKYRIVGNSVSGFVPVEAISSRGTPAYHAVVPSEYGAIFVARDGVFATNFAAPDTLLSADIEPLFFGEAVNGINPINWDQASKMSAETRKNRYYLSYASSGSSDPDRMAVFSFDTKKWYFYDHAMQSLFYEEDTDKLLGGGVDGFIYILEDGVSDHTTGITLDVETKDYFGESTQTRKIFQYFKIDADTDGETLTASFYVDGVLKRTTSITGNRTRVIQKLPEASMGYSWRIVFSYTGSKRPKIYGCQAFWLPLEAA